MAETSGDPIYTLTCDNCGETYQSLDAFPNLQLCPKCIAKSCGVPPEPKQTDDKTIEDRLVKLIELVLKRYRESVLYPQTANVDFRNFAAHDIVKEILDKLPSLGYEKVDRVATKTEEYYVEYEREYETYYIYRCEDRKPNIFVAELEDKAEAERIVRMANTNLSEIRAIERDAAEMVWWRIDELLQPRYVPLTKHMTFQNVLETSWVALKSKLLEQGK
jgi:hypothetical protein